MDPMAAPRRNATARLTPRGVLIDNKKLVRLRVGKAWSRAQLAEAAGVSVRALGTWETGDRKPLAPDLGKVAEALGCQPADLLPPPE